MAPRYKPRSAFQSRHSSGEVDSHPELKGTTLDRPLFDGEVVESDRMTVPSEPLDPRTASGDARTPPPPKPPLSSLPSQRALAWAPLVWLVCVGLGGFVGALAAVLGF